MSETLMHIGMLCRALEGCRQVFVGGNAPLPAAATLLARALSGDRLNLTMLGDNRYWFMSDDFGEVFHNAARGRYDATFFGGGQIDGQSNLNLVGIGKHPEFSVRWPGSRGTPMLYMMIPNSILYSREHTRRVMVPRVDFISAPGVSPPNVYRPGGASVLITSRCVFAFDRPKERFVLRSVHGGNTVQDVLDNTGFEFELPAQVPQTPAPSAHMLEVLRERVLGSLADVYPRFADKLSADLAAWQEPAHA